MQKNLKLLIIFLVLFIVVVGAVFFYGLYLGKKEVKALDEKVTSQIILDRIKDQYFIVTKTMFYDERVEIVATKNSTWKDFLWGEKITAEGVVRIDVGVDISTLKPEDVVVKKEEKIIEINMPKASILDSSLSGNLNIRTRKGVFSNIKDIFSEDEGADYNKAVARLVENANKGAILKDEVFNDARRDSQKIIELILSSLELNYEIKIIE